MLNVAHILYNWILSLMYRRPPPCKLSFFTAFFPIVLALHTAAAILTVINTIARDGPTRNDCCLKVNINDKTVQPD